INDTDYDKIGARIATFAALLNDGDPSAQRDQLLSVIAEKRAYLQDHPSSCAARTGREDAFTSLYGLMQDKFGMDHTAVDNLYRTTIDDYIFQPLDYSKSRTCCWNHTTNKMYAVIAAYAASLQMGNCATPPVFMLKSNSYDPFASYATTSGHGTDWAPWTQDEDCAAAGATDDVVLPVANLTPWCSLAANAPQN
ncbi:MAG TPA: hypothetical protein VFQ65_03150, partial [Kofleriaceae bacterium]|nr:hypothetical protein [Kofleriaceae bacterium]